jgi:hypothetical protein
VGLAAVEASQKETLALLDKLVPLLTRGDTASLDLLPDLRRHLGERGEPLILHIENFDFSCARETLCSLRKTLANLQD